MAEKIDVGELPPSESGPKAAKQFEHAMKRILVVSKPELEQREKAWREGRGKRKPK